MCTQFSSVAQSSPTLCNPMNCSIPGLPVHHQHLEFTQTHGPLSQWCHPAFSSSVIPFSSCPQSLPASGRLKLLIVLELKFYDDKYLWTLGLFHGQTLPFLFPQILTNYFPISLFLCLLIFLFFFFSFIVALSLSFAFKSLWFCSMSWSNKLYTFNDQIIAY